ncbi:MAG: secretin N-terminal domain-containing protein [Phycisphaerales bacterium]
MTKAPHNVVQVRFARRAASVVAVAALFACAGLALAWQDQPGPPPAPTPAEPAKPESQPDTKPDTKPEPKPAEVAPPTHPGLNGRRVVSGEPTVLAFKQVTVEKLLDFIVKATGKVVLPQQDVLNKKITVVNDQPIPREQALDLVFLALSQNGVGVVESDTTITLRVIEEVNKQDVPVIPPDVSVLDRQDMGTLIQKVFALKHSTAKSIGDIIKDVLPDYSKPSVDEESNQIAVIGPVSLVQRVERLITSLDRPSAGALQAATFQLKYADADAIKTNIEELYSGGGTTSSNNNNNRNRGRNNQGGNQGQRFNFFGGGNNGDQATTATSDEVRVSANTQQNSVTVVADPAILEQIRDQITNHWDLALPEEAVVPRTYDLKNSDPIKIRDLLEGLFGKASATAGVGNAGGGGGGGQNRAATSSSSGSSQGVGRLAGQFSFQALPDAGRLVVVSKSVDNLAVIDKIIEDLDQPQTIGLPAFVELKHASAEDLAEQINALLSQDGTLAQVKRAAEGLSAGSPNISPFSASQTSTTSTTPTNADTGSTSEFLAFWWQRSRPPTDRHLSSNLIGQLRVVPVWRQNALLVVAPPEYKQSVVSMIETLDKPGRQVLISAIVAEISADDSLSLGLRWGSQNLTPGISGDNALSLTSSVANTKNNLIPSLFDTSVLNVNVNINALLQALAQKQAVSILSQPKVFTSDNQETSFFDGQDVQVPTSSNTSSNGLVTQTFDYRAVGLQLRARPRITVKGDVDLSVDVQLSSISPATGPSSSFIFDRRQTTTQLIVRDGQTVVISGLLRKEVTDIVRKVPILGDIPLLDWIFKSQDKETRNTELLIFITPIVVNNTDSMDPANEPYRRRLEYLKKELQAPDEPLPPAPPGKAADAPAQEPAK